MKAAFWQFIKFGIVGVSNTLISQVIYFVIVYFGGNYIFASVIGFVISVLNAYYWSNKYVFKEDENAEKRVWWKVLLKTYAAYFWGFLVNTVLLVFWVDIVKLSRFMYPLEEILKNWGWEKLDAVMLGKLAASLFNMAVTIPMNFVINKFWAYRQKKTGDIRKRQQSSASEGRMANLELMRIVSMMFVVALHFFGKGDCLVPLSQPSLSPQGYLVWWLEALAIVAVNLYMLLSGFFLVESRFKIKRFIALLLQTWFYSIGVGMVAAAFGYMPEGNLNVYYLIQLFMPISTNHYWFMTAYIFMYPLAAVTSQGIKRLTKQQFQIVLALMFFMCSVVKSMIPVVRMASDKGGCDSIWYLFMFMVGAYVRLHGIPFFKNALRALIVYLTSATGVWGITLVLRLMYMQRGKLDNMRSLCYDYNFILVFTASVALFYLFYYIRIENGIVSRVICRIAPYTLGVYLWHENLAIRHEWPGWIYAITGVPYNSATLILDMLIAVFVVFAIGIILDMLRSLLFRHLHTLFLHINVYGSFYRWLNGFDIGQKKEEAYE